jgi:hypothetical protein
LSPNALPRSQSLVIFKSRVALSIQGFIVVCYMLTVTVDKTIKQTQPNNSYKK